MNIELDRVCKRFGKRIVLDELSHTFEAGRTHVILGPSGCGKTTLLRLILGLEAPDSGRIRGIQPASAVFQEDRLIEFLSAASNVRFALGKGISDACIADALTAVGLGDALNVPSRSLSGGMRRRTALVRALLNDAPLITLDEPFKGLDAATRLQTIEWARPRLAGRTVLAVTHDPDEAALLGGSIWRFPSKTVKR